MQAIAIEHRWPWLWSPLNNLKHNVHHTILSILGFRNSQLPIKSIALLWEPCSAILPSFSLFSNTSGWMHQLGKSPTLEKQETPKNASYLSIFYPPHFCKIFVLLLHLDFLRKSPGDGSTNLQSPALQRNRLGTGLERHQFWAVVS